MESERERGGNRGTSGALVHSEPTVRGLLGATSHIPCSGLAPNGVLPGRVSAPIEGIVDHHRRALGRGRDQGKTCSIMSPGSDGLSATRVQETSGPARPRMRFMLCVLLRENGFPQEMDRTGPEYRYIVRTVHNVPNMTALPSTGAQLARNHMCAASAETTGWPAMCFSSIHGTV